MSGKDESRQAQLILEIAPRRDAWLGTAPDRVILGNTRIGPLGGYPGGDDPTVHGLFDLAMEFRELAYGLEQAARTLRAKLDGAA